MPHKNKADKLCIRPIKMPVDDTKGMSQVPEPLPQTPHLMLFVGPPGSGKTSLITAMLCRRGQFYNRLYDQVHWFSHSSSTLDLKAMGLPPNRLHAEYSPELIEKILSKLKKSERALFIMDDIVTSLRRNERAFLRLVYNRRHHGNGVSIWLTTQKLSVIPLQIRSAANAIAQWPTGNTKELKSIYEEYVTLPDAKWRALIGNVFAKKHAFLFIRADRPSDEDRYYDSFRPIVFETTS